MLSVNFRRAGLVAAMCTLWSVGVLADTVSVERIGNGIVTGLSADADAAVGMLGGTYETFRWTRETGIVPLGRSTADSLGHRSGIPRISANGRVISATILSDDGTYSTAGRWTGPTGWKMLAPPLPAGGSMADGEDCSAFGLSGNGKIVTGLFWRPGQAGGYAHAMAWSAATHMVDMGSSGGSSRIEAANFDGSVQAGWDEHPQYGNWRSTVWVNGLRTVLVDSDWPSQAAGMNGAGTVIVGEMADPANNFEQSAAVWSWNGQGWTTTVLGNLHKPGRAGFAMATGVSEDGSIVVGSARLDANKPQSVGFIWTAATGMVEAEAYLAANGIQRNPLYKILDISAITPDGSVMAATEQKITAPYTSRSLLIRRAAN